MGGQQQPRPHPLGATSPPVLMAANIPDTALCPQRGAWLCVELRGTGVPSPLSSCCDWPEQAVAALSLLRSDWWRKALGSGCTGLGGLGLLGGEWELLASRRCESSCTCSPMPPPRACHCFPATSPWGGHAASLAQPRAGSQLPPGRRLGQALPLPASRGLSGLEGDVPRACPLTPGAGGALTVAPCAQTSAPSCGSWSSHP